MIVCSKCGKNQEETKFPNYVLVSAKGRGVCTACALYMKAKQRAKNLNYAKRQEVGSRKAMRKLKQATKQPNQLRQVYGLVNPLNNSIFYVGSSIDPRKRLISHITKSKIRSSPNPLKNKIILNILQKGYKPTYIIIENLTEEWASLENYWIRVLSREFEIVNIVKNVV